MEKSVLKKNNSSKISKLVASQLMEFLTLQEKLKLIGISKVFYLQNTLSKLDIAFFRRIYSYLVNSKKATQRKYFQFPDIDENIYESFKSEGMLNSLYEILIFCDVPLLNSPPGSEHIKQEYINFLKNKNQYLNLGPVITTKGLLEFIKIHEIPKNMKICVKKIIILENSNFEDIVENPIKISKAIVNSCSDLESLNLNFTHLQSLKVKKIFENKSYVNLIKFLQIEISQLTLKNIEFIEKNTKLTNLKVYFTNEITKLEKQNALECLSKLKYVKCLSFKNIENEDLECLAKLAIDIKLSKLKLKFKEGEKALSKNIFIFLNKLSIANLVIKQKGCSIDFLSIFSKFKSNSVSSLYISTPSLNSISVNLYRNLTKLKELVLSNCSSGVILDLNGRTVLKTPSLLNLQSYMEKSKSVFPGKKSNDIGLVLTGINSKAFESKKKSLFYWLPMLSSLEIYKLDISIQSLLAEIVYPKLKYLKLCFLSPSEVGIWSKFLNYHPKIKIIDITFDYTTPSSDDRVFYHFMENTNFKMFQTINLNIHWVYPNSKVESLIPKAISNNQELVSFKLLSADSYNYTVLPTLTNTPKLIKLDNVSYLTPHHFGN